MVIGINEYTNEEYKSLIGAVPDADAMSGFLIDVLRANPKRITNLRDGDATRSAIIKELEALRHNPEIQPNDPIIIYFAGHGARNDRPEGWTRESNDGEVEVLCPVDIGEEDPKDITQKVPGIPDYTIMVLLDLLSGLKGNNIVSLDF